MERLLRATMATLLAVLLLAGPAQAARSDTPVRVTAPARAGGATLAPGATVSVALTLVNRGDRAARRATAVFALARGASSDFTGTRIGSADPATLGPGQRRRLTTRLTIPADADGAYRLLACASSSGARAVCTTLPGAIRVTRTPATPTELPTAPPAMPPATAPPVPPAAAPATPTLPPIAAYLRAAITPAALYGHAADLQAIADANGGNRAAETPGYDASVTYVVGQLRAAGYDPQVQPYDYRLYQLLALPVLAVTAPGFADYDYITDFLTLTFSGSGDVDAPVEPIDVSLADPDAGTSACETSDFAGFTPGDIALIQRGGCTFDVKIANAQAAGAAAIVLFNRGGSATGPSFGSISTPADVPVLTTTFAIGSDLATTPGTELYVSVDAAITTKHSVNVIADTPAGRTDRTVVVGGHLDSVPAGPGIDDNGSGVSYLIELATQLRRLGIVPTNRVRFAFFGSEEDGLNGSKAYVASLNTQQRRDIRAYLNFDMLASPNYARFVYDGSTGPAGSLAIQQAFQAALASRGLASELIVADGRADHGSFQAAGIAAGGLFSGAESIKTPEQAALFGGTAGIAFDANYHRSTDTIDQLNLTGFKELADAATDVTLDYALAP